MINFKPLRLKYPNFKHHVYHKNNFSFGWLMQPWREREREERERERERERESRCNRMFKMGPGLLGSKYLFMGFVGNYFYFLQFFVIFDNFL